MEQSKLCKSSLEVRGSLFRSLKTNSEFNSKNSKVLGTSKLKTGKLESSQSFPYCAEIFIERIYINVRQCLINMFRWETP